MKIAYLATVAMLGLSAASADAAIYTNRAAFLAATSGAVTEVFTAPAGSFTFVGPVFNGADFALTSATGDSFTVDPGYDGFYQWNTGAVYYAGAGGFTTLTTTANAIGFDFGNPPNFDSPNSTFTINGVSYGGYSQPTFAFFGITGAGPLGPITISGNGGLTLLDNVTTAVAGAIPEPASWALMIVGFGLVGAAARRRSVAFA